MQIIKQVQNPLLKFQFSSEGKITEIQNFQQN